MDQLKNRFQRMALLGGLALTLAASPSLARADRDPQVPIGPAISFSERREALPASSGLIAYYGKPIVLTQTSVAIALILGTRAFVRLWRTKAALRAPG